MFLGMTPYTLVHVAISLIGILAGFFVMSGLLTAKRMAGWTATFLLATVATSLTGFGFPFTGFTPAIGVGILSMLVLIPAIAARYALRLAGPWRAIYVFGAVAALYLNVFVLVAQAFAKIAALHELAPTGSEPPFIVAQSVVLACFVAAGILSLRRFRPGTV